MKNLTLIFGALITSFLAIGQCEDGRYQDLIFMESQVESDILYGNNIDYLGSEQDLFLDVYTPVGDSENMRPLVILVHGGSFVGGSKTGLDVVPLANDFARMGYATASVQYRLGIPLTLALTLPATEAVLRGYHDLKAAIRFFRKSVAEDGNPYGIDPDKIFIAGVSAGGFVTLHTAYMDELDELPEILDLSLPGLGGGLEGESGNLGYSSEVTAVVNICGAVGDTTWIHSGDEPVLSFHGPFDATVPYGTGILELATFPVLEVSGSESIHIRADEVGIENCFEIYEGQGHVPHVSNQQYYDTTRAIMSNFLAYYACPDLELDCSYSELMDVGLYESTLNQTFLAFPNPTIDRLNFILPESARTSQLVFLDQLGKAVYNEVIPPFSDKLEINITHLPAGVYTASWSDGTFRKSTRVVVTPY